MKAVWDMLSDKKIWALLVNLERQLDEDTTRLMFIELFSRVKKLEEDFLALKVLLLETGVLDEEVYNAARRAVSDFLGEKDAQKAVESDFFAGTGIPFKEWVNFKLNGKFSEERSSEGQ